MNVHDSEKVRGTLLAKGYQEVSDVATARLVLYNTCSIRDKAEQKVLFAAGEFQTAKRRGEKSSEYWAAWAQHKGEEIFEQAPHVSLVCGSAGYNGLAEFSGTASKPAKIASPVWISTPMKTFDTPPDAGATIRIAPTSRSLKAATSTAPTAWCLSPAARSAAGLSAAWSTKRSNSRPTATRKSNCSVRTSTATTTPTPAGWNFRAGAGRRRSSRGHPPSQVLRLHIRATLHPTSCARSTIIRHSATMCICRCNRAPARS